MHPDKHGTKADKEQATKAFQKTHVAYEFLKDESTQRRYIAKNRGSARRPLQPPLQPRAQREDDGNGWDWSIESSFEQLQKRQRQRWAEELSRRFAEQNKQMWADLEQQKKRRAEEAEREKKWWAEEAEQQKKRRAEEAEQQKKRWAEEAEQIQQQYEKEAEQRHQRIKELLQQYKQEAEKRQQRSGAKAAATKSAAAAEAKFVRAAAEGERQYQGQIKTKIQGSIYWDNIA